MGYRLKRKRKNKLFILIKLVLIIALIYIGAEKAMGIFTISSKEKIVKQPVKKIEIPAEVKQSKDPVVKKLVALSSSYPSLVEILTNIKAYPVELLELAAEKPRTIDFVKDYPKRESVTASDSVFADKQFSQGKIPLFIQWDKRWGYHKYGENFMAINGCGPTALAMVASGLTGDESINPKVVADFSCKNGYLVNNIGSSWSLMTEGAKKFGVKGKEIPLSESSIKNTLKDGHPIIATMGPGDFTKSGHFIVLTGITEDGKIKVNDSDSKERSQKEWDVDVFLKQIKNLWAFTKK